MTRRMAAQQLLKVETTCDTLLDELQLIWDDIGEDDEERDEVLLQLEQECLKVYRRKLDQANHTRTLLCEAIAEIQAELASLASALGDCPPLAQWEPKGSSLKEQLAALAPVLEEMHQRKEERMEHFVDVQSQILAIHCEISGSLKPEESTVCATISAHDLSLRRLAELQEQLRVLQEEQNDRLYRVMEYASTIHELCAVLDLNFLEIITEVHPSLDGSSSNQSKSISDDTIERLVYTIQSLQEEKRQRMQKLQDLGTSLIELWNLMDTPVEEQRLFHQNVTCNIAASEQEVTTAGALSLKVIEQTEIEVGRLDQLKASKMKELVLKKQTELEEICRKGHMILDVNNAQQHTINSLESDMVDLAELLASIEDQIGRAKEEAFSRKDIMEKIDKWMAGCEEETWLEDYNKDENRYSATRGAHINLKRAERARATISKIPALVDSLMAKTRAWEQERGKPFLYDGVQLLSTLEEYNTLRSEKEEDKRRQRDQRRLHEQLVNEQHSIFGTRPSPNSRTPSKKGPALRPNGTGTSAGRRLSLGGGKLQPGSQDMLATRVNGITPLRQGTPASKESRKDRIRCTTVLTNQFNEDDNVSLAGARQPLSPVSGSVVRTNKKSSEYGMSKYQTACSPMKITTMRSPLSVTPVGRPAIIDEENSTPQPQSSPQQHRQQLAEYSFEERRLGITHRPDMHLNATWSGCR